MTTSLIGRLTGPAAVAAGTLMVAAELVLLKFDIHDHVATSTDPLFQVAQVVYLLGFFALVVFLFASSRQFEEKAGRFGVFATLAALLGTMALGGDLWFETFAIPWIADESPGAFDTDPTVVLALGAISSYLLFAVGWVLFGIASFRGRVHPVALSVLLVLAGALGFQSLLSPFGAPLGLVIGAIGVWTIRNPARVPDANVPTVQQVSVG